MEHLSPAVFDSFIFNIKMLETKELVVRIRARVRPVIDGVAMSSVTARQSAPSTDLTDSDWLLTDATITRNNSAASHQCGGTTTVFCIADSSGSTPSPGEHS